MADSNDKISAPKGARGAYRKRGSPLTDYMDASEPLEPGDAGEAPQPELSGVPLSGSVSDWAEQIAREAEREGRQRLSPLEGEMSPQATGRVASEGASGTSAATPPGRTASGHPPRKGEGADGASP